jgi:hypothetical protein
LIVISLIAIPLLVILPIGLLLYKIQRDGNRLHKIDGAKFGRRKLVRGFATGVDAMVRPVGQ